MTAANRCAEICKTSGDDSCEVAGSINPNLHILSSDQTRSLGSGAWCAARKSMVIRPMDLATGRKYMSCRSVKQAASCGFSWVIADWIVGHFRMRVSLQRLPQALPNQPPTSGAGDRCDNAETMILTTVGRAPAAPAPHPASDRFPRGRTSTLPHAPGVCPETAPSAPAPSRMPRAPAHPVPFSKS